MPLGSFRRSGHGVAWNSLTYESFTARLNCSPPGSSGPIQLTPSPAGLFYTAVAKPLGGIDEPLFEAEDI
jgi:hypothetical protein